eukprot:XP_028343689.1 uncharacterized protein LOC114485954 [Physeter catodon]
MRPPPGTRASMPSPRPAPRPRPGRGAKTAGRRRARATWRLTSPGRATPSTEERKRGRDNVRGEREERSAEAGARPEPAERLGRAGGRGGYERWGRLASVYRSGGPSAMVAEPRRGCCTDPPPTPRSGPAHLAVSRLAIGTSRRDA